MADNLDVNNDKFSGDINDFSGALSQLAEAYAKRYDKAGQISQGAASGAIMGNQYAGPIGANVGATIGGIAGAFGAPSDEEFKKNQTVVQEIGKKLGLNSDEVKALIDATVIKAQYEAEFNNEQAKAKNFVDTVNKLNNLKVPGNTVVGNLTNTALNSANIDDVKKAANQLGIDISKIDLNSKNLAATKEALLAEVNKFYDKETGVYTTPDLAQPSEEEKVILEQGTAIENKVLGLAQGKEGTGAVKGSGAGTGVDMSVPSQGGTGLNATQNVTLADGTVVPATVNTSNYNSFLNADDPNAFIGITDPTGKTQTLDKSGQVVTGVQATYQYKDVMGDKGWNGLDETGRIAMKKFLYAGNFYGNSDVLNLGSGNITDADVKALTSAMAAANTNGVDVNSYLKPMYEEFLYTGRPFGEKPVDLNGDGTIDAYDQNNVTALQGFFKRNGLTADEQYIAAYDKAIRSGATTLAEAQQEIREKMIAPSYAGWADDIKKGLDLETIASPYKSKVATMLGIDASMIDINDPIMKSILNNKNEEGKPTYTTMEDAEQIIRKDPRWRASDTAQKEVVNGMYSMMERFGIF